MSCLFHIYILLLMCFNVILYIPLQNLPECIGLTNSIIRTSDFFVCVNIFRYNLASPFFWILHLSGIAACGCGFLIFAFTESPCTKFCYSYAFADKRLQYVLCFTPIIIYEIICFVPILFAKSIGWILIKIKFFSKSRGKSIGYLQIL